MQFNIQLAELIFCACTTLVPYALCKKKSIVIIHDSYAKYESNYSFIYHTFLKKKRGNPTANIIIVNNTSEVGIIVAVLQLTCHVIMGGHSWGKLAQMIPVVHV